MVFIVENPDCTWRQIYGMLFGANAKVCNSIERSTLRELLRHGYVFVSGKNGRADTYRSTSSGKFMYDEIISTKDACEFIEFAKNYRNFYEWKIDAVLHCHGDWQTSEFFYSKIYPVLMNSSASAKHVSSKLRKLQIFKDYMHDVTTA